MNRSDLPPAAFIAPDGQNEEQVAELCERVFNVLLAEMSSTAERSPFPPKPSVPASEIPETSITTTDLLDVLRSVIDGSMKPAHPGYIGHMDTTATTVSVLCDLVAAALNNNMLSVEMSPILSRLESELIGQIAHRFGLGSDAGGVMLSGGSLANLQALAVARNRVFGADETGIASLDRQPVLFASDVAHTSLQKAAMLLGLGRDAVVPVAVNDDSQMRVDELHHEIETTDHDQVPFAVVATAGTTTTGNIDPLSDIHDATSEHDLWFHVDAAYGGALVFSEQERHRLAGIENADSITFNPQKWLYVAKTCAIVLFRDTDHLLSHFRVGAPYMRGDDRLINRGEISVQGTRHADVLKFWLSLQHIGERGYAQLIDESYRLTEHVVREIEQRNFLEIASTPETNIVCFRAVPSGLSPNELDGLNSRLQQHLLHNGQIFLSLPTYRESRWLRAVLLNPHTDVAILDSLFGHIDAFVEQWSS